MIQNINNQSMDCRRRIDIINMFRKLWEQHIMWTRSFIISTEANLGDLQYVAKRLMQNPSDFSKALAPYYGEMNAKRFESLLTDHLAIAARLVNAAKAGNTELVNAERAKWYANADAIADFLASINPNWSKNEWRMMLYDHLKLTEDEAVKRLTGEYAQDVALFDVIEDQALLMADNMANGIIKQFHI